MTTARLDLFRSRMVFSLKALLIASLFAACGNRERTLVVLHTNDSHGAVLPVKGLGGLAERATLVDSIRRAYPGAVLLLDAGDINTGQAVSNLFAARPDIEAYNRMGYDAATVGNHEFDKPLDTLFSQMRRAHFPFVLSNATRLGVPLGKEYLIKEVGGLRVGIFGIATVNTADISVHAGEVAFTSEVEAARAMVEKLRGEEVDLVVALTHLGFTPSTPEYVTSRKLAASVEGIDLIVDGHSHSYIEQPERVNGTWIVTAGHNGHFLGEGKFTFQGDEITAFEWHPLPVRGVEPHPALAALLQPYVDSTAHLLGTVVGTAAAPFPLFAGDTNLARYGETAIGNLVADAIRWKAASLRLRADFAVTNAGSIRAAIPAGEVTKGDVLSVLPYGNVLEIVAMKGETLLQLFDHLANLEPGSGSFPAVSAEVGVVFDTLSRSLGALAIAGEAVVPGRLYYMATCDYVVSDKGAPLFARDAFTGNQKTPFFISEALMDYIRAHGEISPKVEGRIKFE